MARLPSPGKRYYSVLAFLGILTGLDGLVDEWWDIARMLAREVSLPFLALGAFSMVITAGVTGLLVWLLIWLWFWHPRS